MNFALVILIIATLSGSVTAQWIKQTVNTTAGFRGLSVVSEKIIWASGTGGTVIRSIDGGKTWRVINVPGGEKLDFRDIEAFDTNTAYILSIGNGEASRIYKTTDGGATWKLQFTNKDEKAFFDAIACWDRNNCIAMSDPVDGHYVLISTTNGGTDWNRIVSNQMPAAKDGEAAFAASGTCLYIGPDGTVFLISGGNDARVFRSRDRGRTWMVSDTPMAKGTPGSGAFSIAMYDKNNGVIVGGNYEKPDERNGTFATTSDGVHWHPGARPFGYRSGVTFIDRNIVIAVGSNGSDISYGRAVTWDKLGDENLNAVGAKGRNAVWAVGPGGAVYRLDPKSIRLVDLPTKADLRSPHYLNVEVLQLSHDQISSTCLPGSKTCADKSTISVAAVAREIYTPHEFVYTVNAGKIVGDGINVEWDLSGVPPGEYLITAGINIPFFHGTMWGLTGTTQTLSVIIK